MQKFETIQQVFEKYECKQNPDILKIFPHEYPRRSEIYNLFQALDVNHPNFPAARRICNCIDALGGDV